MCAKYIEPYELWTPLKAKQSMRRKLFDNPACHLCYKEIEKENEVREAEEEEKREEEEHRRKEEEEENPEFKCDLCTASNNFQSTYSYGAPLTFSSCARCGIRICSGCTNQVPDNYDVPKGSDLFGGVCKKCYEGIVREQADKWDRECKDKYDWPNPYRNGED